MVYKLVVNDEYEKVWEDDATGDMISLVYISHRKWIVLFKIKTSISWQKRIFTNEAMAKKFVTKLIEKKK